MKKLTMMMTILAIILISGCTKENITLNTTNKNNDVYAQNTDGRGLLYIDSNLIQYDNKNDSKGTTIDNFITPTFKSEVYNIKDISIVINTDKNIYELFPDPKNSDTSIVFDNVEDLLKESINYI